MKKYAGSAKDYAAGGISPAQRKAHLHAEMRLFRFTSLQAF